MNEILSSGFGRSAILRQSKSRPYCSLFISNEIFFWFLLNSRSVTLFEKMPFIICFVQSVNNCITARENKFFLQKTCLQSLTMNKQKSAIFKLSFERIRHSLRS